MEEGEELSSFIQSRGQSKRQDKERTTEVQGKVGAWDEKGNITMLSNSV